MVCVLGAPRADFGGRDNEAGVRAGPRDGQVRPAARQVHGSLPPLPRRRRSQRRQRCRPRAQDAAQRQIRRLVCGLRGFRPEMHLVAYFSCRILDMDNPCVPC